MKKMATGKALALLLCALLGGCAATGTRVTSDSGMYKSMADSQQWWCGNVGGCDCTMDGKKVTCSLVQACISSGSCKGQ